MTTIQARITNTQDGAPPLTWSLGGMFFDAWLYLAHNTSLTITQHPVETGAAITDHSYVNPNRFSFTVGMTDVVPNPQVTGDSQSRSVNAYRKLVEMQKSREPLPLVSKYGVFFNILIVDVAAADNFQTKYGGRFTITLQEVIMVGNQLTKVSANPQATEQTNRGQVSAQPLTEEVKRAAINAGMSLNELIKFSAQELVSLLPGVPFAQLRQIWNRLVGMSTDDLINLGLTELKRLFPILSNNQAERLLIFLKAEIQKRLQR
jgi:hypothetical protein